MVEKDSLKEIMKKRNGQLATLLESVNGNGNGIYDKMKKEKNKVGNGK